MRFKKLFAVLMTIVIVLAAQTVTAFALWVDDFNIDRSNRTFQCSGEGKLEVRFFEVDGSQMNFYELQGEFFVDDASLKDEYLKEDFTDAGDFLLVSKEVASITYDREIFGHVELTVKPDPGSVLDRFVDSSCSCYTDLELIDGVYHVTPESIETLEAVFMEDVSEANITPDLTMTLNGEVIRAEVPPFIESDRTMVPVRFISEALGAEVDWDSEASVVTVTSADETIIKLTIGDKIMLIVKGEDINIVPMDAPAIIKEGRTFVPVRFVAEALGLTVGWDGQTRTVSFTD